MYGRADGMPSFQLTVAVCAGLSDLSQYVDSISESNLQQSELTQPKHAAIEGKRRTGLVKTKCNRSSESPLPSTTATKHFTHAVTHAKQKRKRSSDFYITHHLVCPCSLASLPTLQSVCTKIPLTKLPLPIGAAVAAKGATSSCGV
jgi:hypothetical protein